MRKRMQTTTTPSQTLSNVPLPSHSTQTRFAKKKKKNCAKQPLNGNNPEEVTYIW